MRVNKITNWMAIIAFGLCLALVSSWYGAVLYVRHYPALIEYSEPVHLVRTDGTPMTQVHSDRPTPFVMQTVAKRQPYYCWGSYTYVITSRDANYQFPNFRSQDLTDQVQNYPIRNFFTVPAGLPRGVYHFKVVVFPTCDGMEIRPLTLDLGASFEVVD